MAIAATGTTEVNGLYGSLIIDARGNYTYTLKNGVGADSIKTPDSFIYTVKAPNGDTDTASLNITPTAGRWMQLMMSAIPLASPRFRIPLLAGLQRRQRQLGATRQIGQQERHL